MLGQTINKRAQWVGDRLQAGAASSIAGLALCLTTLPAPAETLQISCEQETVGVPEWTGPLVITYEGEESGRLNVKSDHTELSLDATYRTRPEDGAKVIDGVGEIAATMPDRELLDACTAARVPTDFKDDADFYNVTSMSCLGVTQPSAGPVPIKASVRIGILPSDDAIVEIKRTYQAASTGPGGTMYIETYPKNCKLDAGQYLDLQVCSGG
jgi:hypothetical protein